MDICSLSICFMVPVSCCFDVRLEWNQPVHCIAWSLHTERALGMILNVLGSNYRFSVSGIYLLGLCMSGASVVVGLQYTAAFPDRNKNDLYCLYRSECVLTHELNGLIGYAKLWSAAADMHDPNARCFVHELHLYGICCVGLIWRLPEA